MWISTKMSHLHPSPILLDTHTHSQLRVQHLLGIFFFHITPLFLGGLYSCYILWARTTCWFRVQLVSHTVCLLLQRAYNTPKGILWTRICSIRLWGVRDELGLGERGFKEKLTLLPLQGLSNLVRTGRVNIPRTGDRPQAAELLGWEGGSALQLGFP